MLTFTFGFTIREVTWLEERARIVPPKTLEVVDISKQFFLRATNLDLEKRGYSL